MINCVFSIIFHHRVFVRNLAVQFMGCWRILQIYESADRPLTLELLLDNASQDNGGAVLSRPIYTQIMETGPKTLL